MTPGCVAVCRPLAAYRGPFLDPPPSAGGARRPLTPPPPSVPSLPLCLAYPHPLPSPREVAPTQPPDCPCSTAPCWVRTEEDCPRRWPGASQWTPGGGGRGTVCRTRTGPRAMMCNPLGRGQAAGCSGNRVRVWDEAIDEAVVLNDSSKNTSSAATENASLVGR